MREAIAGKLWLGNAGDARDLAAIAGAGIAAVVDLALEELSPSLPRSTIYCRFPIVDGGGNSPKTVELAVRTLCRLLADNVPTLVCCGAGMSRSPAIAAAALALVSERNSEDCLRELVAGQPHDVSGELWRDVRQVCQELRRSK